MHLAQSRHTVIDGLLDGLVKMSRHSVLDDLVKISAWKDDEEGGTVSMALDLRGLPAEALTSELDSDRTTLTIRGESPTMRLEQSISLPAATDAEKIALALKDGRLIVRVEKPPAPPEPMQIPIKSEEKMIEPPTTAQLESQLEAKFDVAPSGEAAAATATATAVDAAESGDNAAKVAAA